MALAMRFAVMVSHDRPWEDKYQAAHDFIYMAKSNPRISLKNLCQFGELVYPGQGKELIEKVRRIRAGEKFIL